VEGIGTDDDIERVGREVEGLTVLPYPRDLSRWGLPDRSLLGLSEHTLAHVDTGDGCHGGIALQGPFNEGTDPATNIEQVLAGELRRELPQYPCVRARTERCPAGVIACSELRISIAMSRDAAPSAPYRARPMIRRPLMTIPPGCDNRIRGQDVGPVTTLRM